MNVKNDNFKDYKKCFSLTDNDGNYYLFVRSFNQKRKGFFNIAKCEVLVKDKSIPKGYAGIIPDAVWFSDKQVAELVGQQKERAECIERAEALLEQWINLRRSTSRKAKHRLQLQRKEVSK